MSLSPPLQLQLQLHQDQNKNKIQSESESEIKTKSKSKSESEFKSNSPSVPFPSPPPLDHHPPAIGLATPSILIIPIHPITNAVFNHHLSIFKHAFSSFPLSECSPLPSPPLSPDNPNTPPIFPNSHAHLLFNFSSRPPLPSHVFLNAFQPHRKLMAIIGIVDCQEWGPAHPNGLDLPHALRAFELSLATHYPRTPVARCFAFNPSENQSDNVPGLVLIPPVGDQRFYLQRLIAEVASEILHSLHHLSIVLQSTSSLETPRDSHLSTLYDSFPIIPPLSPSPPHRLTISNPPSPHPHPPPSKPSAPKARQPIAHMLTDLRSTSEPSTPQPPHLAKRIQSDSTPAPIDARVRKKHLGRIRKLEADLALLGANPAHALRIYADALTLLRLANDHVWTAAATEGLAVSKMLILLAGLSLEHSLKDILETLELAVETYAKALPKLAGGTLAPGALEAVPPPVFVDAVLRLADFKLALLETRPAPATEDQRQDERAALQALLGCQLAREHDRLSLSALDRAGLNMLGSMAELAVGALQTVPERLGALGRLVDLFERIGFPRKAAWFKRELVAVVVEQIGRHGSALAPAGRPHLVQLMEEVCDAFRLATTEGAGGPVVVEDGPETRRHTRLGWRDLQLGVLWDAVVMSTQLKDTASELKYRLKLNELVDEQEDKGVEIDLRLKHDERRIGQLLKALDGHTLKYWGPKDLVLAIELVPLSSRYAPIPHQRRTVDPNGAQTITGDGVTLGGYYTHNRSLRDKEHGKWGKLRMVKDEPVTVLATVQNPLLFELDISMICLSTGGVRFEAEPTEAWVAPGTVQTVKLSGVPRETGTLAIRGCHVRLVGCADAQEFVLAVGKRTKKVGDDERVLLCEVVDAMPLLRVAGGSEAVVESSGLMMYDGERTKVEIELQNTTDVRASWLEVSVRDTLSEGLRRRLDQLVQHAEPALHQLERYRVEHELVHRPVLEAVSSEAVDAHGQGVVRLGCLGKLGCEGLRVRVAYGAEGGRFKREMECVVKVAVQKALKVVGLEVIKKGLLVIKVENQGKGGQEFEVEMYGGKSESEEFIKKSQKQVIQAGSTRSMLVEIDTTLMPPIDLSKPIPNLINRQFIVDKSLLNEGPISGDLKNQDGDDVNHQNGNRAEKNDDRVEKIKLMKTVFGTLDCGVFKHVFGKWKEVGTCREGEINLQGADMSSLDMKTLQKLRSDEVFIDIFFRLKNDDDESEVNGNGVVEIGEEEGDGNGNGVVRGKVEEVFEGVVRVKNMSGHKKTLRLELTVTKPTSTTPTSDTTEPLFLISGLGPASISTFDGRASLIRLPADQEVVVEQRFVVVFLTGGLFKVLGLARECWDEKSMEGPGKVVGQKHVGVEVVKC